MKFLHDQAGRVGKLVVNHVGIAIFSIVLNLTVDTMWGGYALIWVSILSVLFYAFLLYDSAWQMGSQDIVRMEAGRIPMDKTLGLKLALFADLPNLFFCLLLFVGALVCTLTGDAGFFAIVLVVAGFVWGSMYYGIAYAVAFCPLAEDPARGSLNPWLTLAVYVAALVILPAVVHFAYRMGQKNRHLFRPAKKPAPQLSSAKPDMPPETETERQDPK